MTISDAYVRIECDFCDDEVVREMHQLVDRMRNAAGRSPASLEKETSRG